MSARFWCDDFCPTWTYIYLKAVYKARGMILGIKSRRIRGDGKLNPASSIKLNASLLNPQFLMTT